MDASRLSLVRLSLAILLALLPGLAAANTTPTTTPTAGQVYAAYVLLAEARGQTVAYARVIVDPGLDCPSLLPGAGAPLATTPRRNPHGFAVKVCEAPYPFGVAHTVQGGPTLPAVQRRPTKVVVVGDSGCKPKDQDDCTLDDPAWPLPSLAAAAAQSKPDLVIHVGDYNYRGTPSSFEMPSADGKSSTKTYYYDAGDGAEPSENCELPGPYYSQNSTGNPDADSWQAWWLDFFQPANALLSAAPWVFARGNHELCSHAGPGWFYFLDAGSDLAGPGGQLDCPSQDGGGPALPHLRLVQPQVVRLDNLELLVIDSANACDQLPGLAPQYQAQFETATPRLASGAAWLVTHRPIWGLDGPGETSMAATTSPRPATRRRSASPTNRCNARWPAPPARLSCRSSRRSWSATCTASKHCPSWRRPSARPRWWWATAASLKTPDRRAAPLPKPSTAARPPASRWCRSAISS